MPPRRRPTSEFDATQSEAGPRIVTLDSPIGGYQGYVSPDLLSPKFWAQSSNVYAGQFGVIRRARWAPVVNAGNMGTTGTRIRSMFGIFGPGFDHPYILYDNGVDGNAYFAQLDTGTVRVLPLLSPEIPVNSFLGPYMRLCPVPAIIILANGIERIKLLVQLISPTNTAFLEELWGIDAPDASVKVTLAAGSTGTIVGATGAARLSNIVTITATAPLPANVVPGAFVNITGVTDTSFNNIAGTASLILSVATPSFTFAQIGPDTTSGGGTFTVQITKTVGRSYQWAWENNLSTQVSAPSPASQFIKYNNQTGTVDCVQPGTIAFTATSAAVVGTNTQFSPAWVGKHLWADNYTYKNSIGARLNQSLIISVADSTHLTLGNIVDNTVAGKVFQIYDPQSTNIRLYETGDGGSVYFKTARNAFVPFAANERIDTALAVSGLEFSDTANSEPPSIPFSNEITQIYNVPPPVGSFLQDYQGRVLVYGVTANLQTFFYSNIEATVVGQPVESFGTLNTVTMPIGDGQINGMANLPTGLIIWSSRQDMFKLTGLLTDNTVANQFQLGATIQRLPYKIGCASPYATAITPLGAIWLSSDREIWLFTDHYAPKNVGKPIQDLLNRINGARLSFAKMVYYKRGDRSWLALAVALDSSTFNNKLLLLDLDLLASNGQPSFFTFDLATNAPTWYPYDINCEGLTTAYDQNNINHLYVGDVDLITDADWQPGYPLAPAAAEQNVPGSNLLHAFGNEDPHMVKTLQWLRAMTNQVPSGFSVFSAHGNYFTLQDSGGGRWDVFITDIGNLQVFAGSISTPNNVLLNDPSNAASWQVGITTLGVLTTTSVAFNAANPQALTILSITDNSIWSIGVTLAGVLTASVSSATSAWAWKVNSFDDDVNIIGVNPSVTTLLPGISNSPNSFALEYSPALFKFGGAIPIKGRRFQIGTTFPSGPGLFELRGFEVSYNAVVSR